MAFKLAEAYVQFNERGLQGVNGAIGAVAGGFRGAASMANRFGGILAGLGVSLSAGAMLKLAADAEVAETQFRVLLRSGDAAKTMISDIDQFAASTPFEKMQIVGATKQLLALKIPAGEVLGHIKAIGDVSALTGKELGELTRTYAKVIATGKVEGDSLASFMEAGIPIASALADVLGRDEKEIRSLVSAGKVSSADLVAAFQGMTQAGGDFEDGMKQLSATSAGQFSTMKDNISLQAAEIGALFLPLANDVMGGVTGLIESNKGAIGAALDEVGSLLGVFGRNAGDIIDLTLANWSIGLTNGMETVKTWGLNVVETAEWLAENWVAVLTDMGNLTATILANIGANLADFLSAVKSWLAGDGFNFEFTSLTDGFERVSPELKLTQAELIDTTPERDAILDRIAANEDAHHKQQLEKAKGVEREKSKLTGDSIAKIAELQTEETEKAAEEQKNQINGVAAALEESAAVVKAQSGDAEGFFNRYRDSILNANAESVAATKQTELQQKMAGSLESLDKKITKGGAQLAVLGE